MQLHLHVSLDSRTTTGYVALWIMAQSHLVIELAPLSQKDQQSNVF